MWVLLRRQGRGRGLRVDGGGWETNGLNSGVLDERDAGGFRDVNLVERGREGRSCRFEAGWLACDVAVALLVHSRGFELRLRRWDGRCLVWEPHGLQPAVVRLLVRWRAFDFAQAERSGVRLLGGLQTRLFGRG